jgi:general secretion pathway protein F
VPRFSYTAINHKGKTVKGSVSAESAFAARKHLRAKGAHPTSIKEVKTTFEGGGFKGLLKKNTKKQVGEFTKQLATMLNSGIKLTEALTVLLQQITDPQFRAAITDIRDRLVTGESFADALNEYDNYFDLIYISMMRVGEVTGALPESLATIASFMEKRQRIESKMITAMIYPMVLVGISTLAVLILTVKVIPGIIEQVEKAGQELPWVTKAIMSLSRVLQNPWYLMLIAVVIITVSWSIRKFLSTQKGAHLRDRFLLWLPVFGPLVKQQIVARFASTLSTLLQSGLSIADSLKVVAEVTGNTVMNKAVKQARERILTGADIATPLRDSGVIDPTTAHMVAVGEQSGELAPMLKSISDNLEASSDVLVDRLSAATEPLIIVLMAGIIGVIAYATLMPIIQFSSGQF